MLNAQLLLIDFQNDFMDILAGPNDPVGMQLPDGTKFRSTLPVPGALKDAERAAALVKRVGPKLTDVHATLDSHRVIDVAHPKFWQGADGKSPGPFTIIKNDDIRAGIWLPRGGGAYRKRMLDYTAALEAAGKFLLIIWPEHCLIGTWGHNVVDVVDRELLGWERTRFANVNYITKGTNAFTEHYGALMAEVPDPNDPSTQLNGDFIKVLQEATVLGIAGEASSHCVMTTIQQIVDNIGDQHLSKIEIITDCMSPVPQSPGTPDFPAIAAKFMVDMKARGLKLTTHDAFLA